MKEIFVWIWENIQKVIVKEDIFCYSKKKWVKGLGPLSNINSEKRSFYCFSIQLIQIKSIFVVNIVLNISLDWDPVTKVKWLYIKLLKMNRYVNNC